MCTDWMVWRHCTNASTIVSMTPLAPTISFLFFFFFLDKWKCVGIRPENSFPSLQTVFHAPENCNIISIIAVLSCLVCTSDTNYLRSYWSHLDVCRWLVAVACCLGWKSSSSYLDKYFAWKSNYISIKLKSYKARTFVLPPLPPCCHMHAIARDARDLCAMHHVRADVSNTIGWGIGIG